AADEAAFPSADASVVPSPLPPVLLIAISTTTIIPTNVVTPAPTYQYIRANFTPAWNQPRFTGGGASSHDAAEASAAAGHNAGGATSVRSLASRSAAWPDSGSHERSVRRSGASLTSARASSSS